MIKFENVTYSYQTDSKTKNLDSVNLEILDGQCILLCGKSGCGKTTLTRLLNGLIPNFYEGDLDGQVTLNGSSIFDLPMYEISRRVGSVFQNPRTQFYTVNTTSEIAFGCENLGINRPEIEERVNAAAKDLHIEGLLNKNIFNLSGGEKQIIAFASIYAMSPDVYVLDEPSSNLDMQAVEKLRKMLSFLKKQGKTIIIAEHRTYYLKELVDKALYMEQGKIVEEYSMDELAQFTTEEQVQSGIRTVDLFSCKTFDRPLPPTRSRLELKDLRFSYGTTETLHIPHMEIPSGRITAIIGRNGAGKSTFISCLCGLLKKQKGQIYMNGKAQKGKDRINKSYLVMQEVNHQLFSDSVEEEIILGAKESDPEKLDTIMESLDLAPFSEQHPMTLSGGQKQRVIIASAMFCGKKILFFDEPTSGLDFCHMMKTCQLLRELQNEETYLFIITHDYEFITSVCDSVIHIEHGHIEEQYDMDLSGAAKLKEFFYSF